MQKPTYCMIIFTWHSREKKKTTNYSDIKQIWAFQGPEVGEWWLALKKHEGSFEVMNVCYITIVVVFTQLYTCVKFNQLDTLNCSCIVYKFDLNEANLKDFSGQNYPLMGEKVLWWEGA